MSLPLLIGIAGPESSGKTTLACTIAGRFGNAFTMAFATQLRELLIESGELSRGAAYEKPMSDAVRTKLRVYALHYKAKYGDAYFAKHAQKRWRMIRKLNIPAIVHDLRFVCEAEALKEDGGKIIYLGSAGCQGYELDQVYTMADVLTKERPDEQEISAIVCGLRSLWGI